MGVVMAAAQPAAADLDDGHERYVTTTTTKLRAKPKGKALRELPAGTRVRVTGAEEQKFLPIAVPGQHLRGWVSRNDLAPVTKPDQPIPDPGPDVHPVPDNLNGGAPHGDIGSRLAAEARKYIGAPYHLATHGPTSFDCSGLVHWVVLQVTGKSISPDSHAQFKMGDPVQRNHLLPGDLVFYDTAGGQEVREGNTASHVGIVVGPGRMVNALNEQDGVKESDPFSPYFEPRFIGARQLF